MQRQYARHNIRRRPFGSRRIGYGGKLVFDQLLPLKTGENFHKKPKTFYNHQY
jgi:hypothetical protein